MLDSVKALYIGIKMLQIKALHSAQWSRCTLCSRDDYFFPVLYLLCIFVHYQCLIAISDNLAFLPIPLNNIINRICGVPLNQSENGTKVDPDLQAWSIIVVSNKRKLEISTKYTLSCATLQNYITSVVKDAIKIRIEVKYISVSFLVLPFVYQTLSQNYTHHFL